MQHMATLAANPGSSKPTKGLSSRTQIRYFKEGLDYPEENTLFEEQWFMSQK